MRGRETDEVMLTTWDPSERHRSFQEKTQKAAANRFRDLGDCGDSQSKQVLPFQVNREQLQGA